jgi:hypothetical protein
MANMGKRASVAYAMIGFAEDKLVPNDPREALRASLRAGTRVERYGRRWFMCLVTLRHRDRVAKGRVLTRPLWRFRFFAPHHRRLGVGVVRVKQVLILAAPVTAVSYARVWGYAGIVYAAVVVALYLDDYLTGGDDEWRRFLEWLRRLRRRRRSVLALGSR